MTGIGVGYMGEMPIDYENLQGLGDHDSLLSLGIFIQRDLGVTGAGAFLRHNG